jgi:DNA-binding beta-propeller fold protein YncE
MRLLVPLALVLAGCGSETIRELPPAAEPAHAPPLARAPAGRVVPVGERPEGVVTPPRAVATMRGGQRLAVVSGRERVLELYDAHSRRRLGSAPAGVGPTHVACLDRGPCYVADTRGDALLVFAVGDGVAPTRRYRLAGGPYGIALDHRRRRLFVTLPGRNELVELVAHGRPHVVRRWPTVRQPDSVAVDERTGRVFVTGTADGVLEILDAGHRQSPTPRTARR